MERFEAPGGTSFEFERDFSRDLYVRGDAMLDVGNAGFPLSDLAALLAEMVRRNPDAAMRLLAPAIAAGPLDRQYVSEPIKDLSELPLFSDPEVQHVLFDDMPEEERVRKYKELGNPKPAPEMIQIPLELAEQLLTLSARDHEGVEAIQVEFAKLAVARMEGKAEAIQEIVEMPKGEPLEESQAPSDEELRKFIGGLVVKGRPLDSDPVSRLICGILSATLHCKACGAAVHVDGFFIDGDGARTIRLGAGLVCNACGAGQQFECTVPAEKK